MVDSHCHLADERFVPDLAAVIERARGAGVGTALCVLAAGDPAEIERGHAVSELWADVYFAVGAHPHEARVFADRMEGLGAIVGSLLARTPRAVAIGEIGLDYHYDFSPRHVQRAVFAAQVALARETARPIVVHTREADADTLDVLRSEGQGAVGGVFHCFSGDRELASRALDLGFLVSFSGIVTFPGATSLREIAAWIPLDRLLVETDCPYLAPVPYRGRRNEPAFVERVVGAVAGARDAAVETIAAAAVANFERVFLTPTGRSAVPAPAR